MVEIYADCATRRPVAIVDSDSRVVGAVDANDVLQQLSASDPGEAADGSKPGPIELVKHEGRAR